MPGTWTPYALVQISGSAETKALHLSLDNVDGSILFALEAARGQTNQQGARHIRRTAGSDSTIYIDNRPAYIQPASAC